MYKVNSIALSVLSEHQGDLKMLKNNRCLNFRKRAFGSVFIFQIFNELNFIFLLILHITNVIFNEQRKRRESYDSCRKTN